MELDCKKLARFDYGDVVAITKDGNVEKTDGNWEENIKRFLLTEDKGGEEGEEEGGEGEGHDNSNVIDDNTAQKLTHEWVAAQKKAGVSIQEILRQLIIHNRTWSQKSFYAKEKWLKRKLSRYLPTYRILPVTSFTLANAFYKKHEAKIG